MELNKSEKNYNVFSPIAWSQCKWHTSNNPHTNVEQQILTLKYAQRKPRWHICN